MRTKLLDTALILTSTAYAAWLRTHKHQEPDWTFLEVIFGVSYVLAHARAYRRFKQLEKPDAVELNMLRSFMLGGAPIIAGEIYQAYEALNARREWIAREWRP